MKDQRGLRPKLRAVTIALTSMVLSVAAAPAASAAPILVRLQKPQSGVTRGELIEVNPRTGHRVRRVNTRVVSHPERSPAGDKIVWTEDGEYSEEIWASAADGSHARRLTRNSHWDVEPDWSPRGRRIVERRMTSSGRSDLWVLRANGSSSRRLAKDGDSPDWAREGVRIAFCRRDRIFTIQPDGTSLRALTDPRGSGRDSSPQWSPEGDRVLFRRVFGNGDVSLMIIRAADGSHPQAIVPRRQQLLVGNSWSPDGSKILYQKILDPVDPSPTRLRVVRASGRRDHVIASFSSRQAVTTSWSPDSKRVVYDRTYHSASGEFASDLWIAHADGRAGHRLTATQGYEKEPYWASDPDADATYPDPQG